MFPGPLHVYTVTNIVLGPAGGAGLPRLEYLNPEHVQLERHPTPRDPAVPLRVRNLWKPLHAGTLYPPFIYVVLCENTPHDLVLLMPNGRLKR